MARGFLIFESLAAVGVAARENCVSSLIRGRKK